jgi:hypothetical protein
MGRLICRNKKSNAICWIDPEWDERSYAVMLKLMKKKAEAEEDAKQCEGELGKANCELREIRNELKIA